MCVNESTDKCFDVQWKNHVNELVIQSIREWVGVLMMKRLTQRDAAHLKTKALTMASVIWYNNVLM